MFWGEIVLGANCFGIFFSSGLTRNNLFFVSVIQTNVYDINTESTLALKIHPYVFNSNIVEHNDFEKITTEVGKMLEEVKKVGGSFKAVSKNQDFSEYSEHQNYYSLLKQIYEIR